MAINPMQAPIDYLGQMGLSPQDPAQALVEGLKIGEAFRQRRQMREQEQLAEQYKADASAYYANPTPQGALELARKYPEQGAALMRDYRALGAEQRKGEFDRVARPLAALAAGRPDIAKKLVSDEILAAKEAGGDATNLETINLALENDPDSAYGPILQVLTIMDPDKAEAIASTLEKTGTFGAKEEGYRDLTAEEVAARGYPPGNYQIGRSGANEGKVIRVGGAGVGGEDQTAAQQRMESDLNTQYWDRTKDYRAVLSSYEKVVGTSETAAGDQALIYNFMKMLDPNSAVLPGEYATAQNAGSVPARFRAAYNKAVDGTILDAETRSDYRSQAKRILRTAQKSEQEVRKGITGMAERMGLNVANIFYNISPEYLPEEEEEDATSSTQAPPIVSGVVGMPSGETTWKVVSVTKKQ
jgi:hypothetical protein